MPTAVSKFNLPVTGLLCIGALGLVFAPPSIANSLRATVRDIALPGQQLAHSSVTAVESSILRFRQSIETTTLPLDLRPQLDTLQLQTRQLQLDNAFLREKLQRIEQETVSPYWAPRAEPLLVPELLRATVLGTESSEFFRAGLLIDKATRDGLVQSSLVLEDTRPLIDQGNDAGVKTRQFVYAGFRVVGRIAHVGRHVSTVQRITDQGYAGAAQLARRSDNGLVRGAEGVLEGCDKPLCRLKLIGSTEYVDIGDEVFTAEKNGTLSLPMYYGKVAKAELSPDRLNWEIWVQPAINDSALNSVQVLRTKINPARETVD